jgi:cellulose synthase/poly-beta-1,6-N-acetylglucosamine synthase-like glycosyltransferase
VCDGCTDLTATIAKKYTSNVLEQPHTGKSAAINNALKKVTTKYVAIIDGDSIIHKDALLDVWKEITSDTVGASCAIIKVQNNTSIIGSYLHVEQIFQSYVRFLFSKINATSIAPGPLTIYNAHALKEIDGFSTNGYAEDADVAIRLLKSNYTIKYSRGIVYTIMPVSIKGFILQRTRFARGALAIFTKHLRFDTSALKVITVPLAAFAYLQAVFLGVNALINISQGYITYFASHGEYISWGVLRFFVEWISIAGLIRWTIDIISTNTLTWFSAASILASILTYGLYILAMRYTNEPFNMRNIAAICILFPFYMAVNIIYILQVPWVIQKNQPNKWKKNYE